MSSTSVARNVQLKKKHGGTLVLHRPNSLFYQNSSCVVRIRHFSKTVSTGVRKQLDMAEHVNVLQTGKARELRRI